MSTVVLTVVMVIVTMHTVVDIKVVTSTATIHYIASYEVKTLTVVFVRVATDIEMITLKNRGSHIGQIYIFIIFLI
jgi:hypothetical protein